MNFLLVHSPAVGPSTWRWVAEALRSKGHETVVPDLVGAAASGDPAAFARAAAEAFDGDEPVVTVGHSAAGGVLPLVAQAGRAGEERRMVFVHASVPPCDGPGDAGGEFLVALQVLATDGVLLRSGGVVGPGGSESLVPDDAGQRDIEAELLPLPLSFFAAPIVMPPGWCDGKGAFVLLSEFYRADADRAAALGWPVVEHLGAHLDIANDEDEIADLLVEVAERL